MREGERETRPQNEEGGHREREARPAGWKNGELERLEEQARGASGQDVGLLGELVEGSVMFREQ